MQNLVASEKLEITSHVAQRTRLFVEHLGFSKIQPVGWIKDESFDLSAILSSSKNNYPFGFCPHNDLYIVDAHWDWSKIPKDLPMSRLAFSLILGVEAYSTCILQNVGRKKIKLDDKWSHRPCSTGIWYKELTSTINLEKLTDDQVLESIQVAQQVIDTVCTLTFSETATQVESEPTLMRGRKYEARRVLSSLYMLDITTEMPLTIDDRIDFLKVPRVYAFRSQATALSTYTKYFRDLASRLSLTVIADLISDLITNDLDLLIGVLDALNMEQLSSLLLDTIQNQMLDTLDQLESNIRNQRSFI